MSGDKNNKDTLDYLDRACGLGVGKLEDKCEERSLRVYEEKQVYLVLFCYLQLDLKAFLFKNIKIRLKFNQASKK